MSKSSEQTLQAKEERRQERVQKLLDKAAEVIFREPALLPIEPAVMVMVPPTCREGEVVPASYYIISDESLVAGPAVHHRTFQDTLDELEALESEWIDSYYGDDRRDPVKTARELLRITSNRALV